MVSQFACRIVIAEIIVGHRDDAAIIDRNRGDNRLLPERVGVGGRLVDADGRGPAHAAISRRRESDLLDIAEARVLPHRI
jgi:hypothetical protein